MVICLRKLAKVRYHLCLVQSPHHLDFNLLFQTLNHQFLLPSRWKVQKASSILHAGPLPFVFCRSSCCPALLHKPLLAFLFSFTAPLLCSPCLSSFSSSSGHLPAPSQKPDSPRDILIFSLARELQGSGLCEDMPRKKGEGRMGSAL